MFRTAHYELREFSSTIAYFWLAWLGTQSICKQKFTKHIMEITESKDEENLNVRYGHPSIRHPPTMKEKKRAADGGRNGGIAAARSPPPPEALPVKHNRQTERAHSSLLASVARPPSSTLMSPLAFLSLSGC